jgi:hypothetical protein
MRNVYPPSCNDHRSPYDQDPLHWGMKASVAPTCILTHGGRQLAGVKEGHGLNHVNENMYAHFIMAWDGYIARSVEFVGSRQAKPLDQMG